MRVAGVAAPRTALQDREQTTVNRQPPTRRAVRLIRRRLTLTARSEIRVLTDHGARNRREREKRFAKNEKSVRCILDEASITRLVTLCHDKCCCRSYLAPPCSCRAVLLPPSRALCSLRHSSRTARGGYATFSWGARRVCAAESVRACVSVCVACRCGVCVCVCVCVCVKIEGNEVPGGD